MSLHNETDMSVEDVDKSSYYKTIIYIESLMTLIKRRLLASDIF